MTQDPSSTSTSTSISDHHNQELATCHDDENPNQQQLLLLQEPPPVPPPYSHNHSPNLINTPPTSHNLPILLLVDRQQKNTASTTTTDNLITTRSTLDVDAVQVDVHDDEALKREDLKQIGLLKEAKENKERDKAYNCSRQGNWILSEILILLEAKEAREQQQQQQQMANNNSEGISRRNRRTSSGGGGVDKWKDVSDYCKSKGVNRSKEQCKVKWDNMMPDFRKVKDYEDKMMMIQKESSGSTRSYFELEIWERRARMLPSNMDMDVYQRISNIILLSSNRNSSRRRRLKLDATKENKKSKKKRFIVSEKTTNTAASKSRGKHDSSSSTEEEDDDDDEEDEDHTSTASPIFSCPSQPFPSSPFCRINGCPPSSIPSPDAFCCPPSANDMNGNHLLLPSIPCSSPLHKESASGPMNDQDMLNRIEDRKDARHKEWMALEREKLAVFKEANLAIVNAMTKAMSTFSKVAEELVILRQEKGTY